MKVTYELADGREFELYDVSYTKNDWQTRLVSIEERPKGFLWLNHVEADVRRFVRAREVVEITLEGEFDDE